MIAFLSCFGFYKENGLLNLAKFQHTQFRMCACVWVFYVFCCLIPWGHSERKFCFFIVVVKFCILFFCCFRASDRLKKLTSNYVPCLAVVPRSFMSSSISTETVRESKVSKEYGSEQIQVNCLPWWACNNWAVLLYGSVWNLSSPVAIMRFF